MSGEELVMVTPPVEEDMDIPLPAVRLVTPEFSMERPEMFIPVPSERDISPVCPEIERTPVLVMVGFCPPDTAMPCPGVME